MNRTDRVLALSLLTILVSLLLVGAVSGTILRHAVQVVPIVGAGAALWRRLAWGRFAALPLFAFWLLIMSLIWLFLLGLARVITGRYTPAEVALTVAIGMASLVGIVAAVRGPARPAWWAAGGAFLAFGALQLGAMWLSVQPLFATR
jgi:hypothetical protein